MQVHNLVASEVDAWCTQACRPWPSDESNKGVPEIWTVLQNVSSCQCLQAGDIASDPLLSPGNTNREPVGQPNHCNVLPLRLVNWQLHKPTEHATLNKSHHSDSSESCKVLPRTSSIKEARSMLRISGGVLSMNSISLFVYVSWNVADTCMFSKGLMSCRSHIVNQPMSCT